MVSVSLFVALIFATAAAMIKFEREDVDWVITSMASKDMLETYAPMCGSVRDGWMMQAYAQSYFDWVTENAYTGNISREDLMVIIARELPDGSESAEHGTGKPVGFLMLDFKDGQTENAMHHASYLNKYKQGGIGSLTYVDIVCVSRPYRKKTGLLLGLFLETIKSATARHERDAPEGSRRSFGHPAGAGDAAKVEMIDDEDDEDLATRVSASPKRMKVEKPAAVSVSGPVLDAVMKTELPDASVYEPHLLFLTPANDYLFDYYMATLGFVDFYQRFLLSPRYSEIKESLVEVTKAVLRK